MRQLQIDQFKMTASKSQAVPHNTTHPITADSTLYMYMPMEYRNKKKTGKASKFQQKSSSMPSTKRAHYNRVQEWRKDTREDNCCGLLHPTLTSDCSFLFQESLLVGFKVDGVMGELPLVSGVAEVGPDRAQALPSIWPDNYIHCHNYIHRLYSNYWGWAILETTAIATALWMWPIGTTNVMHVTSCLQLLEPLVN